MTIYCVAWSRGMGGVCEFYVFIFPGIFVVSFPPPPLHTEVFCEFLVQFYFMYIYPLTMDSCFVNADGERSLRRDFLKQHTVYKWAIAWASKAKYPVDLSLRVCFELAATFVVKIKERHCCAFQRVHFPSTSVNSRCNAHNCQLYHTAL